MTFQNNGVKEALLTAGAVLLGLLIIAAFALAVPPLEKYGTV